MLVAFAKAVNNDHEILSPDGLMHLVLVMVQSIRLVGAAFDVEVDTALLSSSQVPFGPRYEAQSKVGGAIQQAHCALLALVRTQRHASSALNEHSHVHMEYARQDLQGWHDAYEQLERVAHSYQEQNGVMARLVKRMEYEASEHAMQVRWLEEGNGLAMLRAKSEIGALHFRIEDMRASWHCDKYALTPTNFDEMRTTIDQQQKMLLIQDCHLDEISQELTRNEQDKIIEQLLG